MQVWVYKHFLFLSGILLRTFTNHRTAGVGEGHSFDSSIPLPHIHRHLDISPTITAEISLWHIFRDQAQTGNHWFFSTSNLPLCHALHLLKTCLHHRYFSAHSRYFENIYYLCGALVNSALNASVFFALLVIFNKNYQWQSSL